MAAKNESDIKQDEPQTIAASIPPQPEAGSGDTLAGPVPESCLKRYPKNSRGGIAVIINNKKFDSFKERTGADADMNKLDEMFNNLGFEQIVVRKDKTCDDITKFFTEEPIKSYTGIKCFVCVILSYGNEGYIYGTGGANDRMEINDVVKHFKGCDSLIYVPKVFIFQTCPRKDKEEFDDNGGYENQIEEEEDIGQLIPFEADVLMVQSCIPGHLVWGKNGMERQPSWFIDAFTETVNNTSGDILSTLTHMNRKLAKKHYEDSLPAQLPYISSTLRKELFLRN